MLMWGLTVLMMCQDDPGSEVERNRSGKEQRRREQLGRQMTEARRTVVARNRPSMVETIDELEIRKNRGTKEERQ